MQATSLLAETSDIFQHIKDLHALERIVWFHVLQASWLFLSGYVLLTYLRTDSHVPLFFQVECGYVLHTYPTDWFTFSTNFFKNYGRIKTGEYKGSVWCGNHYCSTHYREQTNPKLFYRINYKKTPRVHSGGEHCIFLLSTLCRRQMVESKQANTLIL
jgi:hypothetical protein